MEDVSFDRLEEIAREIGTPFYLYDPAPVREVMTSLQEGIAGWGEGRVAYSVKTNPLSALLREVRACSGWVEVVSVEEFFHALEAGFEPGELVLNGPLKAAGLDARCLDAACINIDGLEEIPLLEELADAADRSLRVGLRVCTPFTSPTWSRFGLSVEAGEFVEAVAAVRRSEHLRLSGLHAHLGTQVPDPRSYLAVARLLRELWTEAGLDDSCWLDLGGGFPFDHAVTDRLQVPGEEDFFGPIKEIWGSERPFLILEPGRIVAAPCMSLVCRVISRKRRPREPEIVVVDSGTNHNVMGAFYEHRWEFSEVDSEAEGSYRICGPLCMEDDVMSGERKGRAPGPGALARMHSSGAYSFSLSRSFIQAIPPVITSCELGPVAVAREGGIRG